MRVTDGGYGRIMESAKQVRAGFSMADRKAKPAQKLPFQAFYPERPAVRLEISAEGRESLQEYIRKQEGDAGPETAFLECTDGRKEEAVKAPESDCEKRPGALPGVQKPKPLRSSLWTFCQEADAETLIKEEQQAFRQEQEQRRENEAFLEELDEKMMTELRDAVMEYVRGSISELSKMFGKLDC